MANHGLVFLIDVVIVSLHVADKMLDTVACNLGFLVDIKSRIFQ